MGQGSCHGHRAAFSVQANPEIQANYGFRWAAWGVSNSFALVSNSGYNRPGQAQKGHDESSRQRFRSRHGCGCRRLGEAGRASLGCEHVQQRRHLVARACAALLNDGTNPTAKAAVVASALSGGGCVTILAIGQSLFAKRPTKYLAFLMARLDINVLMKEVSCTWTTPRNEG